MNKQAFHIGTYVLQHNARTDAHVRALAACGIDLVFAIDNDRATLELLHRHGVGAVVTGVVPGWFGGNGDNAGTLREANPPQAYLDALRRFCDHPAIWGIDVGDEPSCRDFAYYGEVLRFVRSAHPDKLAFLNLYPSYGMLADNIPEQAQKELGTAEYREYLRQYCQHTDTDYLCFDHYMYASSPERLLRDLQDTADACRRTGRSLWTVLQVSSHEPDKALSENQLRLQASMALAFGVECIAWACYSAGWWHHHVLDANGNQTPQYAKLQQVNREIRAIADEAYMHYRWLETACVNAPGAWADAGRLTHIHAADGTPLLVSTFRHRTCADRHGVFFCAVGDPLAPSRTVTVQFRGPEDTALVYRSPTGKQTLAPDGDGWYRVPLAVCAGGWIAED